MVGRRLVAFGLSALLLTVTAAAQDKLARRPIKAVDWRRLAKVIPEKIEGLDADELDGGTYTTTDPQDSNRECSYSTVERAFFKEQDEQEYKEITIRLIDPAQNKTLAEPFMAAAEYDQPEGRMKTVEINGRRANLLTEKDAGKVVAYQVMLLIADRFMVQVEGNDQTTPEEVQKVAALINYDKLAALGK